MDQPSDTLSDHHCGESETNMTIWRYSCFLYGIVLGQASSHQQRSFRAEGNEKHAHSKELADSEDYVTTGSLIDSPILVHP
jgi:hypothetical protein